MSGRKKLLWTAAFLVVVGGVALWAWRWPPPRGRAPVVPHQQEHQIWVEACRPVLIHEPLEITGIGERGEKGLYCAPGGAVATENDGGDAVYRFYVPAAGQYRLWGYCRWLEPQAKGFVLGAEGNGQAAISPSGPPKQWQWLPLAQMQLGAGVQKVTLTAKGGGFGIRRFFLSNSAGMHPLQSHTEITDIFNDDFDGCLEGEFDSWNRVSGEWTVHHREDDKSPANKILVGKSSSEAMINVGAPDWRDYSVMLDCRTVSASSGATAALKLCRDREGNGLVLQWKAVAPGQVQMELLCEDAVGVKTLDRFTAAWDTTQWSELSADVENGSLRISINSLPVRTIEVSEVAAGSIGLWLQGGIEMMFDNVQVCGRRVRAAPATQGADRPTTHPTDDE